MTGDLQSTIDDLEDRYNSHSADVLHARIFVLVAQQILAELQTHRWECGCGTINGIGLAVCSICHRTRGAQA